MVIYPIPGNYKNTPCDVSVIVPLYKSKDVVRDQIMRWCQDDGISVEIIYVNDNCPQISGTVIFDAWNKRRDKDNFVVKLISLRKNHGFGTACNIGAYHAKGKHLIFLNADTVVTPNWIAPILESFQDPTVGIVGNLQLKEGGDLHGTVDGAGSEWFWESLNFLHIGRHSYQGEIIDKPFHYTALPKDLLKPSEREMVTGCCLAIPKSLFDQVGGFNMNYKIGYWEDSELNLAVRELGYKVMYQPESVIYHKLSHSNVGEHQYHQSNKAYFLNKWVHTGRIDTLVKSERTLVNPTISNILVRRIAAHGDVLVAAAVVPALKKKFPGSKIYFETKCPSVLVGNPAIDFISEETPDNVTFNYVCDLDLAYERRPKSHILESYAEEAGVPIEDCVLRIPQARVNMPMFNNYVVIHAGTTNWVGRNWHENRWEELAMRIHEAGFQIICVGRGADHQVSCDADCRNHTSVNELAAIMHDARLFVGIDSLPFHIAQAMDTPGVVFFGSIDPTLRIINNNMTAVTAKNLACLGCHHRKLAPSTVTNRCETGTLDCENLVTVDDVWNIVKTKLGIQC